MQKPTLKWYKYVISQNDRVVTISVDGKTVEIVTKKALEGFDIGRAVMLSGCLVADQAKMSPDEPVWDSYGENFSTIADLTMLVAHFYYLYV